MSWEMLNYALHMVLLGGKGNASLVCIRALVATLSKKDSSHCIS